MSKVDEIESANSEDLTTVVSDDLRALLFWASVGVHLSSGGYREDEITHMLESYAEHIAFSLPYPPVFAKPRLKTFQDAAYIEPVRHEREVKGGEQT